MVAGAGDDQAAIASSYNDAGPDTKQTVEFQEFSTFLQTFWNFYQKKIQWPYHIT